MNVHVLYVLGSLLSPDHSFERLRGAIVTLMNQLFIMRFNFDPWARTQYHSTNDNYTQCLIWTIARSCWILEFAFIALAVCKCSSIWKALVQGKKYNPNFKISRWKSMALGLKKLQGMLVHDVGEGAMGFYPPWGRLCPRSSRAGFISVD